MAVLTRKGRRDFGGYQSGYQRDELIQKLGRIEWGAGTYSEAICTTVCKHRDSCENERIDDAELWDICEDCPLNSLMELIE